MRGPRYGPRIVKRNQMAAVYLFGLALAPSGLRLLAARGGPVNIEAAFVISLQNEL